MSLVAPKFGVGARVHRLEDDAFIRGQGRYTDDICVEGQLYAFFVRSAVAKATFALEGIEEVRQSPGVHLVLTGADVAELGQLDPLNPVPGPNGEKWSIEPIPLLCESEVRHVGDAIAMIVADTLAQARDAAELLEVDYELGDAVATLEAASATGASTVYAGAASNHSFTNHMGDSEAVAAVFAKAPRTASIRIVNNRLVANYMEPRAAIGEYDPEAGQFTLITGSQGVHGIRDTIAEPVLRIDPDKLRVVTPDVGGGFGPKAFAYREYPLVLEAARKLGRPVKWTCDRTEHFLTDAQGRDNITTAEMAMDDDGRFLALKVHVDANMGAYHSSYGPLIPWFGASMGTGVYDIGAMSYTIDGYLTNTAPVDAYRGAGRPEAAFMIERLVDACAREMNLSPVEIRKANFIKPDQFPYTTPGKRMYDVGEFAAHLDLALQRADWATVDVRKEQAARHGKIRGIGLSTYVEICAFAGSEAAKLKLELDGTVTIDIGTQSNGQGHATAYAQFAADQLGIEIDQINVVQGDTDRLAKGGGTGGSRSVPLGGVSTAKAAEILTKKMIDIAANELEAAPDDIELVEGEARIVGTDRSLAFAQIASAAKSDDDITGIADIEQHEGTYPNGTHVCEVEIDPETGTTKIVNYTIVDDFGVTVNPLLLEGQVHGGVVQGVGQCLNERTVYDEDGQLLTASFMDYNMPRADDMPMIDFTTRNVPSTTNALGIKGAGEAGTIGACPAVINAIIDALHNACGIDHVDMPVTPDRMWASINKAGN